MIDEIRKQIKKDTGLLVIPANTTANKPPLPFATINVTSPYIKGVGHSDVRIFSDDAGTHMKSTQEYGLTLSFNVYAKTDLEAIDLARKVKSWFDIKGYYFLQAMNLVVVDLGNIENRTAFLVDSYENKQGFDVRLRATDEQFIGKYVQDPSVTVPDPNNPGQETTVEDSVTYDWIEHVEIKFNGVKTTKE